MIGSTPPQALSAGLAAFAAALVETVEALTVVLAVGTTRGWRSALAGAAKGSVVLAIDTLLVEPSLALLPLPVLRSAIGLPLLHFGLRWLRKAILRSAAVLPLHDEAAIYASQRERLDGVWNGTGLAAAFQVTLVEGLEVVFIVVAVGAGRTGMLTPASLGAAAALLAMVALGTIRRRPLARVPENVLKFGAGRAPLRVRLIPGWRRIGPILAGRRRVARRPRRGLTRRRDGHRSAAPGASTLHDPAKAGAALMPASRCALRLFASLFVDDTPAAASAVVWVLIATRLLSALWPGDAVRSVLLFAGLALTLAVAALRHAMPSDAPTGSTWP